MHRTETNGRNRLKLECKQCKHEAWNDEYREGQPMPKFKCSKCGSKDIRTIMVWWVD